MNDHQMIAGLCPPDLVAHREIVRAGFDTEGRLHFELDGGEFFTIYPGFEWRYQTQPSSKERGHVFGSVGATQ